MQQKFIRSVPGYTLALNHVSQYYDMELATFGIDRTSFFVVAFPVMIKPLEAAPITLYEIETVPVPIPDSDSAANSFSEVQVSKPYIATTSTHYIQLHIQELCMCKHIWYEYFCEEMFMVKHSSKYTCESTLFYNNSADLITQHCEFNLYENKTVLPSVLDGGSQIILANF